MRTFIKKYNQKDMKVALYLLGLSLGRERIYKLAYKREGFTFLIDKD